MREPSRGGQTPSPNGDNGRDGLGRFLPGNPGGNGNPHARQVSALRQALLAAVTEGDIQAVVSKLVEEARAGKPWAIRELLDRTIGKPTQAIVTEDADGNRQALTPSEAIRGIIAEVMTADFDRHLPGVPVVKRNSMGTGRTGP